MRYSTLFALLFVSLSLAFTTNAQTVNTLYFSSERGFYEAPFVLTLSTDEPSATIRYTLDNSKPSSTNGFYYNGQINITGNETVRAVAYTPTSTTEVQTHSYIFLDEIINSGYMNHPIQSNPIYNQQQVKAALLALPTVSITSSRINSNNHIDNEIETSVELFFPDSTSAFNVHCGIETWGGSPTNPKKNYRLEFKAIYGLKSLDYPVFDDGFEYGVRPATKFDELLLRAGSQDGLNAEYGNLRDPQLLRNRFLFDREMELGYPAPHGRYVHTYVNGEYMGQYHLMERPNGGFLEVYFGGDKENYETRKSGTYIDNPISPTFYSQLENYCNNNNLNNQSNYQGLENYVDLQRAADYLVINHWIANFDWSKNHNSWGITDIRPGKQNYKFMLWDVDMTMGNVGTFENYYGQLVNYNGTNKLGPVPSDLVASNEFKVLLGDRLHCHCFNDGLLTRNHLEPLYRTRSNSIELPLLAETIRWAPDSWSMDDEWSVEVDDVINVFFQNRSTNLINFYKGKGYYPSNTKAVEFSQYGGDLPNGSLTLSNPNSGGTIYYTTDGSDPRSFGGSISPTAQIYSGTLYLQGVTTIKARVNRNGDWSAMCPRTFYAPQNYADLIINEIHYSPNLTCDSVEFLELKNIGTSSINLKHSSFSEGLRYRFEEDAILPPNGFLVLTDNKDAFQAHFGFAAYDQYIGQLAGGGELIALEDPLGILIDAVEYNDKNPWPITPDGQGPSLELTNEDLDNDYFGNWHPSVNNCGTPNAENSEPCSSNPPSLVINEINYSSLTTFDSGDWVELHNPTTNAADVSGWKLQDSKNSFDLPVGTIIPPGGFLVLVENDTFFTAIYPEVTNYISNLAFGFSSGGEQIQLSTHQGCLIDVVDYEAIAPWPIAAAGDDATLSLTDSSLDNSLAESWEASGNATGTPGEANTNICEGVDSGIVINEINYNSPLTFDTGDWLELHNTTNSPVDLSGWQLHDNLKAYEIPLNTIIPANGYLVLVSNVTNFTNLYPTVENYLGPLGLGFGNGGEKLRLYDASRCRADLVHYDDVAPWPTAPDGNGPSLSLIDPLSDNALGENWEASPANGTPGRENIPCPLADFKTPTEDICVDFSTTFLAEDNLPDLNYSWSFEGGNPSSSTSFAATTTWENTGDFKVTLAIEYFECTDTTEQLVTVQACNTPPNPQDDTFSTNEDTPLIGNLLPNDSDADGDSLFLEVLPYTNPTYGQVTLQVDGSFVYTPNNDYTGQDSFAYSVCDDGAPVLCSEAIVIIDILPQNDAPRLLADNITTNEDTEVSFNVLDNDSDIDGQLDLTTLEFFSLPTASEGAFSVDALGNASFIPAPNYSGILTMTYQICDDGSPLPIACATTTLTITVTSQNDAPLALDDSLSVDEEILGNGNVLNNDSDLDGNALTVDLTLIVEPQHGQVTISANGNFTYQSNVDYNGLDEFTYLVCDDGVPSLCDEATVAIQVNPVNDPPSTSPDNVQTVEETPINILVLANDLDVDDALVPSSLTLITPPPAEEGEVFVNEDGTLTFIPTDDFYGNVSPITYQICDEGIIPPVQCSEGNVNINVSNVNDAPVAVADSLEVVEGESILGNLLNNDYDIENNALEANPTLISSPTLGSLTLDQTGNYTYTPYTDFSGEDSFIYEVCDTGQPSQCSQATVWVNIIPCPEALMIIPAQACATSAITFEAADQGAGATYSWSFGTGAVPSFSNNRTESVLYTTGGPKTVSLTVTNAYCTVNQTESITIGQAAYADAGADAILCPGESTQLGASSTGPFGATFVWTPSYNINNTSVANPVAYPDTTTTYQVTVTYGDCTLTDEVTITVENGIIFADAGIDQSDCGEGVRIGGSPAGPESGVTYSWSPTIGLDDPFSPNPLVNTPITKTYTLTVNRNGCIATDEVSVERKYPPSLDAGVDQTFCYDPDGQGVLLGGGANFPSSQYEWTPNVALTHPFEGNTFANPQVTTTYTLTATKDGCSASDQVTVLVDICNETPIAVFDRDTTFHNTPLTSYVLDNDSDPDGSIAELETTLVGSPLHGQVIMQLDGNYTYLPDSNYIGNDEFIYQICDSGVPRLCERAKVFLLINGPECIDFQLSILLEGPYNKTTDSMSTELNTVRGVLPGQAPSMPYTLNTAAGHPYAIPPWNYFGTEGLDFDSTSYNNQVVDWVLVSLRTGLARSTEVYKTAALLENDGRIVFVGDCMPPSFEENAYYVLVEHRNHMGALTPEPIPLVDFSLTYDFRLQDSYNGGAGFGQKQIGPNRWAMYAGDGDQTDDLGGYDISGDDKVKFTLENGNFNSYLLTDFNLDGDVNGKDKILWSWNNGVFSVVPR